MKHKIRFVCRKEKKALKNHPCGKTRWGRYIMGVLDSYYDNGSVGIGDGIVAYDCGFEHPLGEFYHKLVYADKPLWSMDERMCGEDENLDDGILDLDWI